MGSLLPRVHAVLLALSLGTAGCLGGEQLHGAANGRVEGPITPVEVPDQHFSADLHSVLRDGRQSPERLGLLSGVVRRQLAHAAQRFGSGHDTKATEAVIGALYLLRTGEGRSEMIDAAAEKALAGAAERVSARGDEGRAEALLKMRAAALDPASPARKAIDDHLASLADWKRSTRTGGPMRKLG